MDEKTIKAIETIIRRRNDAKVRRKGRGYVVVEILLLRAKIGK